MPAKENLKHTYMEKPLENVMDYFFRWLYLSAYSPLGAWSLFFPPYFIYYTFYATIVFLLPYLNLLLGEWTETLSPDGNTYNNGYFMLLEYIGISDYFPIFLYYNLFNMEGLTMAFWQHFWLFWTPYGLFDISILWPIVAFSGELPFL